MRRSFSLPRPVLATLALLAALALSGCGGMWDVIRENERGFALDNARNQSKRGKCVEALDALDRAEAIMEIDRFAIESTQIRIRCYEKLGLPELQVRPSPPAPGLLHRRADGVPGGATARRSFVLPPTCRPEFDRPPSWLKIERPRYTAYAQRSKIIGRVVVGFGLREGGKTNQIRVLEMSHPLLASWAIEAVAQAKPKRTGQVPVRRVGSGCT